MVSDIRRQMVGNQEGTDDQRRLVSGTQTKSTTEYMLTVAQDQTRLASSGINGSSILYLHTEYQANRLPQHQGPASDAAS